MIGTVPSQRPSSRSPVNGCCTNAAVTKASSHCCVLVIVHFLKVESLVHTQSPARAIFLEMKRRITKMVGKIISTTLAAMIRGPSSAARSVPGGIAGIPDIIPQPQHQNEGRRPRVKSLGRAQGRQRVDMAEDRGWTDWMRSAGSTRSRFIWCNLGEQVQRIRPAERKSFCERGSR